MRKYEAVWVQLKKDSRVSIIAPFYLHKRIVKAVCKEKYKDMGYKLELIEHHKRARIHIANDSNRLTFEIKISIGRIGI